MNYLQSAILSFSAVAIIAGGYYLGKNVAEKAALNIPAPQVQSAQSEITPTLTQNPVGLPQRIIIPKLKVNTVVEAVGEDSQGRMAVPSNNVNTAWWKYGPRPGENGSAVIDGHLDSSSGGPAVFYYLDTLTQGDTIEIFDDQGKEYIFKVTDKQMYFDNMFPINAVFSASGTPGLNLITCEGVWDAKNKNYNKRLVVFSQLQP